MSQPVGDYFYGLLGSLDALHKRMPVCPRAVSYQIARGILSEPVRDALIGQIGVDGFRFVSNETDTLTDFAPASEVQPCR
jgi:hypothetical protein